MDMILRRGAGPGAGDSSANGVPDAIFTDYGKVFTGRLAPHRGPVRPDPWGTRDLPPTHRRAFPDHHRQDRAFHQSRAASSSTTSSSRCWAPPGRPGRLGQCLQHRAAAPGPGHGPADRFRLAPLAADAASVPVHSAEKHPGQWVLRRVASNGVVQAHERTACVPATRCLPLDHPLPHLLGVTTSPLCREVIGGWTPEAPARQRSSARRSVTT